MIGFLPQEFPKFNVIDYSTKGMSFYDLDSGKIEPHVEQRQAASPLQPELGPERQMDRRDRACRHGL